LTSIRKLIVITILILIPSILFGFFDAHVIRTQFNEEIASDLRTSTKNRSLILMESIKSGDEGTIKSLCSDEFLKQSPDLSKVISLLKRPFDTEKFELIDEYYNIQNAVGSNQMSTIVPLQERRLMVSTTALPKYSYMQFWKSDSLGFQHLLFIYYGQKDNKWELIGLNLGNHSIENQIAPELIKNANKLFSEKKYVSSVMYALAARKVMRPGPFLQYQKEKDYTKTIDKIIKTFETIHHFPISLGSNKTVLLFSVDLVVTTSGIDPVFKYVTSTDVTDGKGISVEAKTIYPEIHAIFPDAQASFNYVILQAYYHMPSAEKAVPGYNTIFRDGKQASFK
jgi:hypothetical protein